ncbi:hypothetical protein [Chamaesiphon sp.]|uniref:hypothetical protein n=1 Tax=Chamaesiphon sp. TaxID=2814140 RepID=UPI00359347DC
MSMEHKAFIFDYEAFELELKEILETALDLNDTEGLEKFIKLNINYLIDPYEGEQLSEDWNEMLEYRDPHEYGDFALTKFYNATDDIGLNYEWIEIGDMLSSESGESISIFGNSIGKDGNYFDPGKMGSYFQSSRMVKENNDRINILIKSKLVYRELLTPVSCMFDAATLSN